MSQKKTILMAVGSSGGHIYPAVAVAERLEEFSPIDNKPDIHFVHSGSLLGKKTLSSLKYPSHEISIGGLAKGQSFFQKMKTLLQIPRAFIQSLRLIKKLKVQIILGTGGSVTGPVLMTGVLMNCKTAFWEGNAVMGLTNKWLSPFVSCIFTVFPRPEGVPQKKQILCSYPLRKRICNFNEKPSNKEDLLRSISYNTDNSSLESKKKLFKVLILGGSQGSFFLNQIVSQAVEEENWRKNIFIYHQTGKKSFNLIREKYKSSKGIEAFSFSLSIEEYYKKCDLIFSRAGSGAIWEIASYGKALILIPLTYSAGGHQLKNALELSSKNCVEMIREKDFNVTAFKNKLIQLKQDKQKRDQLAKNLKTAHQGNGAKKIADWILSHS